MALLIREQEVRSLVDMADALETTQMVFRELGRGAALNQPRRRLVMGDAVMHMLPASVPSMDVFGFKVYTTSKQGARFAVWLFRQGTGELLAMIEADWLGRLRTGAASGVATMFMARPEASTLGVFGTGRQARTQMQAVAAVRNLSAVYVSARNQDWLAAFCREMSSAIAVPVEPATPEQAACQDIVCTITTAQEPVCLGEWLRDGAHINAAGSNRANARELDHEAIARCKVIVCDDVAQAQIESGDLIDAAEHGTLQWEQVRSLGDVIAGMHQGRTTSHGISLFKSLGIGAEDVALAARVYDRARERGVGESVDFLGQPLLP